MPLARVSAPARLPAESAVLTKAVCRAAEYLEFPNALLAKTIGLSPSTVSRLRHGGYLLKPNSKEFELGALFVRLFRSLDAIMGSDDVASRAWLRVPNRTLASRPIDRIVTIAGLVDVVAYLDASRAPV